MRLPVFVGHLPALAMGRGRGASGKERPNTSATAFIVDAVPIVLQWPTDGADASAASKNSSSVISPAANLRRLRQMIVPEPTSSPSCQPSSIGPPDSTIAGISTAQAAMIPAGVVLSQPVVSTTASIG